MSAQPDPNFAVTSTFKSRKFILALLSILLITGFAVAGIWFNSVAAILPSFIGGILGVLSVYFGGNVANKFVVGKNQVEFKKAQETVGDDGDA